MKAILLCAGFGTRMYPLTKDRAKPLLPVAGKPIVARLVDQLDACECFDEIVVVTNDRFHHQFIEWGDDRVTVLNDKATDNDNRLGAVQDLAWAIRERRIDEPVLVAAGDNLFRNVIEPFVADYRRLFRNLVACYHEPDPAKLKRTGVAEIEPGGRLIRLVEKPASPPTHWACPALYVLERDALAKLETYRAEDALGHLIAWLAPQVPVFTHEIRGRRLDVGNLEEYARAESWLENGD